ncbi:hypothetical protein FXV83_20695 [Bradyrhizobium hipponense]|uniref:Uncharacterized protein n=1 Tax=Bradyrhizobium hipponense TaxID=2605638 RepID=A0A5S4YJP8_9BRAD|nr:hypothetical protein [Bradyrhizobium hipponense]TYO64620.1 hypothetical protein FXV83_20695 [Bradyrhizobium hipponense]
MILSTHAILGAAVASALPSHPVVAFVAGFASHFAIDAIPHWDYPLKSISLGLAARNDGRLTADRLRDFAVIGFDALAGLFLAIAIFGTEANWVAVVAGAVGGMLPDPLQFVHTLSPGEPLATLQRFHSWIHSKRKLTWPLGVSSQIAFASAVAGTAIVLQMAS